MGSQLMAQVQRFVSTGLLVAGMSFQGGANAAVITSSADPLLAGASTITFSEVAVGTSDPVVNGVSFTGIGATLTTINSAFPGQLAPILGNSAVPPFTRK